MSVLRLVTIAVEMSASGQPERDDVPELWGRVAELVDEVGGLVREFCAAAQEHAPGAGLTVSVDVSVPAWTDWQPGTVPGPGASSLAEYAATLRAVAEALPAQLFASAASATESAAGDIYHRARTVRSKTHGVVLDVNGRRLVGDPIVSGEDRTSLAGLVLNGRERLARSLLAEVEPKVAAGMRRGELPHWAVLVLNNPPCRGPLSCERYLPWILPAGTRLTI